MFKATIAITCLVALLLGTPAMANPPVHTGWFSDLAVDGYDVVSYFTDGEPREGSAKYRVRWRDAEWRFATREHLQRFRKDPERYAPAYGGYCALAIAEGTTAAGDPRNWAIHEDRLYLNYDDQIQARWDQDRDGYIVKADQNWPEVAE